MAKNMKQKLREQKKKNHEEFRKEMVQDLNRQLEEWQKKTDKLISKNNRALSDALNEMANFKFHVISLSDNLSSIEYKTLYEMKRFKRGRSWKFFAACYLASLIGGLTAVVLCGLYWPTIRSILG